MACRGPKTYSHPGSLCDMGLCGMCHAAGLCPKTCGGCVLEAPSLGPEWSLPVCHADLEACRMCEDCRGPRCKRHHNLTHCPRKRAQLRFRKLASTTVPGQCRFDNCRGRRNCKDTHANPEVCKNPLHAGTAAGRHSYRQLRLCNRYAQAWAAQREEEKKRPAPSQGSGSKEGGGGEASVVPIPAPQETPKARRARRLGRLFPQRFQ